MTATAKQQRGIRITLAVIVAAIAVILGLLANKWFSPRVLSASELSANGAVEFDKPRIIKPFELIDQNGNPFGLDQLEGRWSLVFFGFTACPDICPATLSILSRWLNTLDADIARDTQVILLSVDPARDTPDQLKQYLDHFNSDIVGLTGEFLQVKRMADNLNVGFNKVPIEGGYTVDHSGLIALVNPYGHYHGFFRPPHDAGRLKLTYQSIVTGFDH